MGQVKFNIAPSTEQQATYPLPAHWDELDEAERDEWIAGKWKDFLQHHGPAVTVEVTE